MGNKEQLNCEAREIWGEESARGERRGGSDHMIWELSKFLNYFDFELNLYICRILLRNKKIGSKSHIFTTT